MTNKTTASQVNLNNLENVSGGLTVNSQITDNITQTNVKVLGESPAVALGNLYQATAHALANAAYNATYAQQQATVTAQATTTMGVSTLLSIDTATTGKATKKLLGA